VTQLGIFMPFLKGLGVDCTKIAKTLFCKTMGAVDLSTLSQYGPAAGSFANCN